MLLPLHLQLVPQIMARTGRYKMFPIVGLGAMSAGLLLLFHARRERLTPDCGIVQGGLRRWLRDGEPDPDGRDPERGQPA